MGFAMQTNFATALINPEAPVPSGLIAWNGPTPERRFGVYRNNVAVGLVGALASRFPVVEKIVGAEFFAAMASEFIRHYPPRSPLLLSYGDEFPKFVASFEPATEIAYLPDVIRLEMARSRAYHAADAVPLDPSVLAAIDPEKLAGLVFEPHPSLSVLRSPHPVVTIWAMNAGEIELGPIDDWQGEDALVTRAHLNVEVCRLPPGGAAFLEALAAGVRFAGSVEAAVGGASAFDLSTNLAGALRAGAFRSVR
ncbi:DUF2063 domain-containing protein [Rhizobium grahamii]|uniref:DUF2063 domain-containing protein n=2 Tax=Rhizobium grahamii TaxID=1120045 RepID=A0A370KX07_9HYPH|nr:DUF2063 domain-containing protein [Rhizobium grahamii]